MTREGRGRNGIGVIRFEMFEGGSEAGRNNFAVARGAEVAGNADDADDLSRAIAHGQFGCKTPPGAAADIPMEFEAINDGAALLEDGEILAGVLLGEFFWKNIAHVLAQQFLLGAQAAALNEGFIDGDVASPDVLDKENNLGNVVKKRLDGGQFRERAGERVAIQQRFGC